MMLIEPSPVCRHADELGEPVPTCPRETVTPKPMARHRGNVPANLRGRSRVPEELLIDHLACLSAAKRQIDDEVDDQPTTTQKLGVVGGKRRECADGDWSED